MTGNNGGLIKELQRIGDILKLIAPVGTDVPIASADWTTYSTVVPTRASADDPTYVLTFTGVNLTSFLSVGMRVRWVQNGTTRFAIITAISFSTDTTLTLYGGTDYDVDATATYPISGFSYSSMKAPFGFPIEPTKWMVTGGASGTQASPTQNVWYNIGGSLVLPIGAWQLSYTAATYSTHGAGDVDIQTTLSDANNSETDSNFRSGAYLGSGTILAYAVGQSRPVAVSAKTTKYLNMRTAKTTTTQIWTGVAVTPRILAICAYL